MIRLLQDEEWLRKEFCRNAELFFCDGDEAGAIVLARNGIRRPLINLKDAKRISGMVMATRRELKYL